MSLRKPILAALAATATIVSTSLPTFADTTDGPRTGDSFGISSPAITHAPISVMGDHTHKKGEWMFSYRFMNMKMEGNRAGTNDLSAQQVGTRFGFNIVPTKMTGRMHMFGAMYAPDDRITLMAMLPYVEKSMEHVILSNGVNFTTRSRGWGDFKLSGLVPVYENGGHKVHLNLGFSAPTGDIGARDSNPASGGAEVILPYPMQLGSGTWDLLPGITYVGCQDKICWGGQYNATLRLDENDHDYTLGDRHNVTTWGAYSWHRSLSTSLRLGWTDWGNIDGADPQLNPAVVQTANPDFQGGSRLDLGVGVNYSVMPGTMAGNRLALEMTFPVHQDLDGVQLETDWILTAGWQYTF